MLAFIEVPWEAARKVPTLSREDYAKLHEIAPSVFNVWEEGKETPPHFYSYGEFLVDLSTDGVTMTRLGIDFRVRRFKGAYKVAGTDHLTHTNVTIQVAIPAIGLLEIDEVQVLEDVCTDQLGRELEDGWRIVAVCPPDAQRRPDYILGRSPAMRRKQP